MLARPMPLVPPSLWSREHPWAHQMGPMLELPMGQLWVCPLVALWWVRLLVLTLVSQWGQRSLVEPMVMPWVHQSGQPMAKPKVL